MKKHVIRSAMSFAIAAACCASFAYAVEEKQGELLYNGIRLPAKWPPRIEKLDREPIPVPYLLSPPEVINIDVGRQLFVDDFLVEATTLERTNHRPEFYAGNPILKPEKPWEQTGRGPMAIPHSGGVCYDPQDRLFKLWYITGYQQGVGLVYSKDGLHWERPAFDHVKPGTNMVMDKSSQAATIWMDLETKDPARRFVQYSSRPGCVWFSADGINWGSQYKVGGFLYDRTTIFWNPFRKVWVYSIKGIQDGKRARRYWETPQLVGHALSMWRREDDPTFWIGADSADPPRDDLRVPCQLYDLDCVAYESVLLGSFIIWRGDYRTNSKTEEAKRQNSLGRPKQNSPCIGYSRDGFYWHRPDRRPFMPLSDKPSDWNWGNSQTACMSPLVVGDKLYFYVAGRAGLQYPGNTYQEAGGSTGVAFLRRDGFASMDAGEQSGELTTRPLRFTGKHLFVNADVKSGGELLVEVLDKDNRPIAPFNRDNCIPISVDKTLVPVRWNGAADLAEMAGKAVKFRFIMKQGRLYSFWVSPDESGASRGYVAGGGPGFTGPTDTVGTRGY